MSEEQLKAFLEKVNADTSLQKKLKAAADSNAVTLIAREAGFTISTEDLETAKSKLSDKALEAISGGSGTEPPACTDGCYGIWVCILILLSTYLIL